MIKRSMKKIGKAGLLVLSAYCLMSAANSSTKSVEHKLANPQATSQPKASVEERDTVMVGSAAIGINTVKSVNVSKVKKEEPKEEKFNKKGWTKARVNVRKEPNLTSDVLDIFEYNTKIKYHNLEETKEWVKIKYDNTYGYIYKKYVSKKKMPKITYKDYSVPAYSGRKSWMPYTAIRSVSSLQYKLQRQAYTGNYGIRMVGDRYCVALGSYFTSNIGQYFDLILRNGTTIKCILGDAKANQHTDSSNIFTVANGCCSEFIVDRHSLNGAAARSGDISSVCESWDSPVSTIRVYDKNFFE